MLHRPGFRFVLKQIIEGWRHTDRTAAIALRCAGRSANHCSNKCRALVDAP